MPRLRTHAAALADAAPLDVFCGELVLTLGADSTDAIAILALRPAPDGRVHSPDAGELDRPPRGTPESAG